MLESRKKELCEKWRKLSEDFDRAESAGRMSLAYSFEKSMARIEDELGPDIDPRDYREP